MIKSKLGGEDIVFINNQWFYEDGTLINEAVIRGCVGGVPKKPCSNCGNKYTEEGHDGCLGTLIGVMNACCGHGTPDAYVQFLDGECVRGEDAIIILDILKKWKKV